METIEPSKPLGQRAESYWIESRRPLASLIFLAPLLLVYEVSVSMGWAYQNGGDAFLRKLLDLLGLSQHFLLPLLLVFILLGWHHLSHQPWRISGSVLSGMAVESLLLGLGLRVLSLTPGILLLSIGEGTKQAIAFIGAGVYEELLFRLILFSAITWAFQRAGTAPRASLLLGVVISSLLFAAAHNIGPYGDPWQPWPFLFRTMAGVFFALVYQYRGFGIAAGSHFAYDVIVGLL